MCCHTVDVISPIVLLQPFMSPRYPGGPRVPVRMPNEFNGVSLLLNCIFVFLSLFLFRLCVCFSLCASLNYFVDGSLVV